MAKRKQRKGAKSQPAPQSPPVNPAAATPEQLAAAQEQAAQRARTEFAVLKQRFAEVSVALTIAEAERDTVFQQLQSTQQTIEQLTASLAEATKKPAKKGKDGEEPSGDEAEES